MEDRILENLVFGSFPELFLNWQHKLTLAFREGVPQSCTQMSFKHEDYLNSSFHHGDGLLTCSYFEFPIITAKGVHRCKSEAQKKQIDVYETLTIGFGLG